MTRSILFAFTAATLVASGAENVLRNGSFEGGLLYWHNIRPEVHTLARGEGKVGEYALRLAGQYVMSAPVALERDKQYTISLWARGEEPGRLSVAMPPSAREIGQKSGRLWTKGAGKSADIGADWTRVSFTFPANVPQTGFWRLPHYLVQIQGEKSKVVYVDGVTVTEGTEGTPDYVPRRQVEILSGCTNLPGYAGAAANVFEVGATAQMTAHVSNPGVVSRNVIVRWQLLDYEGIAPVGDAVDRAVILEPGKMVSETAELPLTAKGCVIARLSVFDDEGELLDSSDFPLTSLPYPKNATKPDWRERFGGSFAGGKGCIEKFQRLGFGWVRWRPHANGRDHLPERPAPGQPWKWTWFDDILDEQEAHGVSSHIVLYPPPDWIMEKGNPLPTDMRWPADDPRWDDLGVETVWDTFVTAAVDHYRGRSVIFEIENEPDLGSWSKHLDQYATFTIRTARQIRKTDPDAKIMINNVYGIPSRENGVLFKAGGLKYIDVISWHDYHAGWLAHASTIQRARQNLDENGGKHVEIWFNEGWAYTNTLVDEPIACTGLASAKSCNDIMRSVAELSVVGQEKTVIFHTAYEQHGMSFWDYCGPGTMLWDWYNYPLPLVAAWNVMTHHIGISDEIGFVRPPHANLCVFQDQRNDRGVMVAYADDDAEEDARIELPDVGAEWVIEDIMGNRVSVAGELVLSKTGRPVFLYSKANTDGKTFLAAIEPTDRKYASFVSQAGGALQAWELPASWAGTARGSSDGSVVTANGQPVWSLEQVWPPKPGENASYRPMVWNGTVWHVDEGSFGGQPTANRDGRVMTLKTRAPHGPDNDRHRRVCALTFHAPADGDYALSGSVSSRIWDGKNKTVLRFLRRTADRVEELHSVTIPHQGTASLDGVTLKLSADDRLSVYPDIEGMFAGGQCELHDFVVRRSGADAGPVTYRLPAAWAGIGKGSADGNPITVGGEPVWRLDQVYPADPLFTENYVPMPWNGTHWKADKHDHGGHPSAKVENGNLDLGSMGPWKGLEFQKIGALVFVAPKTGTYRVTGEASAHPWTGGAKHYTLSVRKKDTQRAPEIQQFKLPRDKSTVVVDFTIDLNRGHELAFVSQMPDWHNGCSFRINGLAIALAAAEGADSAPAPPPADSATPTESDSRKDLTPAMKTPVLPADAIDAAGYCIVNEDGHLSIDGKRIRFWGAIGSFPSKQVTIDGDPYAGQKECARRVKAMGFNMHRIWHLDFDDDYEKGDLSGTDISDFYMAECARQGIRIWAAGFGSGRLLESEVDAAAKYVDDPASEAEWKEATRSLLKKHYSHKTETLLELKAAVVAWDPRLEVAAIESMRHKAQHVNKHTGRRHSDDPNIVIWEITNEQWWMRHMVGGQWKQLPLYFRRSLLTRWHRFLRGKYKNNDGLRAAWGFLLPGEDLGKQTVLLAPMAKETKAIELNDTNPEALAAFRTVDDAYGRDDFTRRRGEDALEFFVDLIVSHKQRVAAAVKTWGKSCRLSPLLYDTGIGENIQSQFLHQNADAVAHCSYMEGVQLGKLDPRHKRWPWYSGLDRPPQMANDVPWLEHNRIEGKPFLCYETQFGSPSKYRAEWPSRLVALASIQDWDAICFHYWTFSRYKIGEDRPYSGGHLPWPAPGAEQYNYTSDEVEFSQMRTASAMFRGMALRPAPMPTTFTFGGPALYDPVSMDYAGSYGRPGLDMCATTYRYGMRMAIDPGLDEFVKIDGPVVRFNGYEQPCPIQPTDQLTFDYKRGFILADAPAAAHYVGFFGEYGDDELRFRNGVTVSNIHHLDPDGIAYPSGDEKFTAFTLTSEDGQPLATCAKAVLSLVASSFNTGLQLDLENRKQVSWGRAPVLVTRVGATIRASALVGMTYRMLDFDEKILGEGRVGEDGELIVSADLPVFVTELSR